MSTHNSRGWQHNDICVYVNTALKGLTDASGLKEAWMGDWWYQLLGSKWATTGIRIMLTKGHSWHCFPSVPSVEVMTSDIVQKRAMAF